MGQPGRGERNFVRRVIAWGSEGSCLREFIVKVRDRGTRGDEDLYDLAAVQTFLNDGVVYAVERDRMPKGAEIAAIFRY